jgi:hypothetical protein
MSDNNFDKELQLWTDLGRTYLKLSEAVARFQLGSVRIS